MITDSFEEVSNGFRGGIFLVGGQAPASAGSTRTLPHAPSVLDKARWYLSPRYWKQGVAVVGIYSIVLATWAYVVR